MFYCALGIHYFGDHCTMSLEDILQQESSSAVQAGLLHGIVIAAGRSKGLDVLWAWGTASLFPVVRPMQPDSIFDMASVTKAVATASACAISIDKGILSPEAPASLYIPDIGQFPGSEIKVCNLASHCSGYDDRKFYLGGAKNFIERVIKSPAQRPAEETFEYSCRNFILLGLIVEEITGENLADFCRKNLFVPAGMHHTLFGPLSEEISNVVPTQVPAGVISDEQARIANRPLGNAGLFSTAEDLALFCRMILSGGTMGRRSIIRKKGMRWISQSCSPPHLPRKSFGWDMSSCYECSHRPFGLSDSAIGHSGWTGHSVWIDPEQDLFFIVLTNRSHALKQNNYEPSKRFRARISEILLSYMQQ